MFALLPNKQADTYIKLLSELKILQQGLNPETIMTDFELAAINCFRTEFPQASQRGCFFHHNQCIWRRVQALGLQQRYQDDEVFALQVRMLPALAFVPPDDVIRAFTILTDGNYLPGELDQVVSYFESTWIGQRQRGNRRRQPMYPVQLWNCYDSVRNRKLKNNKSYKLKDNDVLILELGKTNNSCEGWHRGFLQLVGAHNPSI